MNMERILIVDDDITFALMLRTWLAKRGFEVETAGSAAAARTALGKGDYALVLSDMRLPDEDGIALLQWMAGEGIRSGALRRAARSAVSVGEPPASSESRRHHKLLPHAVQFKGSTSILICCMNRFGAGFAEKMFKRCAKRCGNLPFAGEAGAERGA